MARTLFFIDSRYPSKKQQAEAAKLGAEFRYVPELSEKVEDCEYVFGCVPDSYKGKKPAELPKPKPLPPADDAEKVAPADGIEKEPVAGDTAKAEKPKAK